MRWLLWRSAAAVWVYGVHARYCIAASPFVLDVHTYILQRLVLQAFFSFNQPPVHGKRLAVEGPPALAGMFLHRGRCYSRRRGKDNLKTDGLSVWSYRDLTTARGANYQSVLDSDK